MQMTRGWRKEINERPTRLNNSVNKSFTPYKIDKWTDFDAKL